jgi:hypothetical protein
LPSDDYSPPAAVTKYPAAAAGTHLSECHPMTTKRILRIVVASPSDVNDERQRLDNVISEINRGIGDAMAITLELIKWETDTYPQFHPMGPQGAVDQGLRLEDCDIIIGIFWTKLGTPTVSGETGTEHELRSAHEIWKQREGQPNRRPLIMLYINNADFDTRSIALLDSRRAVLQFRDTFTLEGALYGEYKGPQEFEDAIRNHLTRFLKSLNGDITASLNPPLSEPPRDPAAHSHDWGTQKLDQVRLYTFNGLQPRIRDSDVFQDFKVDRQRYSNPNPLSYLWADVYTGSTITASIIEAANPFLKIQFNNQPISWPGNICIRPIAETAIPLGKNRAISVQVRMAKEPDDTLSVAAIAFRVINGFGQHWAYGPGPGRYKHFLVQTVCWSDIQLSANPEDWWLFTSDGNYHYGPKVPNLEVIAGVVIEVGSDALERPGPGKGTIHVKRVCLTS